MPDSVHMRSMRILVALVNVFTGGAGLMIQRSAILAAALFAMAAILTANGLTTASVIAIWMALFPLAVALGSVATGLRQELRAGA